MICTYLINHNHHHVTLIWLIANERLSLVTRGWKMIVLTSLNFSNIFTNVISHIKYGHFYHLTWCFSTIEVISLVKSLFLQLVVNRPHQVTISTQVVPRDVVARASRDRAQTPLGRQLPRPPSPLHQLQPEPDQLQQDLHHLQPELGRRKREWELWSEELVSKQRGPRQGGLQPCSQVGTPNFSQPALLSPTQFI